MEATRWLALSPLVVAVTIGALGPGAIGAAPGEAAWDPPPCPAGAAGPPASGAWYRLDPVLDRSGTLAARRLVVGVAGGTARTLDLAPESFASGPVDGLVLAGSDDGTRSRLQLLDPARSCAITLGDEADVIRSAVAAADGVTIYEHRVDRATRADLGVWRRSAGGPAQRVLEGLEPDERLGPTFATDLLPADDGRLVISSCAPAGCRVRVLDPGGRVTLARGTGPALGVTGASLVVREACRGLPCALEAIDLPTGRRTTLAADAFVAALAPGGLVVYETPDGRVASVDVATGRRAPAVAAGGVPIRRGSTASAGAEAPPGSVALAPDGRPGQTTVRHLDLATGLSRGHAETTR